MDAAALPPTFTHLRVHSHYTLLGATLSVAELVARAAADGLTALALTDSNVLYGAVEFAQACAAAGIQPLLGMTLTVAAPEDAVATAPGEVVLLATDPRGWRSLCGLSSAIQARPDREAAAQIGVDWETLAAHRAGLICLAGGRRSGLGQALIAGHTAGVSRYAGRLAGIFGDNLWLTLELHNRSGIAEVEDALAQATRQVGNRLGVPLAAVQPIFCGAQRERSRLRLLAALAHNARVEEVDPAWLPDGGDNHLMVEWPTPADLAARYAALPDALAAVGEIVARCGPALPDGRPIWPVLPLAPTDTPDGALRLQAEAGLRQRYGAVTAAQQARVDAELALIAQRGIAPLFLLVAEITAFARQQEIPYNTRGSVANALVAYCLGITTVDPLAHDLLFERFLNPARTNLPDIDLDLCSRRRDEVLEFVRARHGATRVALVATMTTLRPKSAVRETAKAYGLDEETIAKLAELVRDEWHPDPRRRRREGVESVLADVEDATAQRAVAEAYALVGTPHHLSIHPGGVVIAPEEMTALLPVQWTPKGFWVTQFSHGDVEALGLPKMDLLGIRALTVLSDAVELVRQTHDPTFHLHAIPADDALTGDLLARGETIGVFQCESSGAQRTLRQLRARTVRDLAVANAFFKPGPATGGMAQAFVRRYRGEEAVSFLHPALAAILGPTQGVLLFQEQVLRVATEIAGLSWGEADQLRKGISKFQGEAMTALQARFVAGCQRPTPTGPGFSPSQAKTLWTQVLAFAGYGFNQGHATAYADVSYRSAYLKAHWPAEFLAARLADGGGFHHQAVYMAEARRLGIAVRPPHVNASLAQFTLQWTATEDGPQPVLWMGLGQVRDLRRASVQGIIAARRERPLHSVGDLLARVSLGRQEVVNLIQAGALDGLGVSRAALLAEMNEVQGGSAGQLAFGFVAQAVQPESPAHRMAWEQRLLGVPVSVLPLETLETVGTGETVDAGRLPDLRLAELGERWGQAVTVAGTRLPGWTGGKGWFLADGDGLVIAIPKQGVGSPRPWKPVRVSGRWSCDACGDAWLQVEAWSPLDG